MRRYTIRVTAPRADVAAAIHDLLDSMMKTGDTSPLTTASYGIRTMGDDSTEVLLLIDNDDGLSGHALSSALRKVGFHVDESTESEEPVGDDLAADALEVDATATESDAAVVEIEPPNQMAEASGPEPELA